MGKPCGGVPPHSVARLSGSHRPTAGLALARSRVASRPCLASTEEGGQAVPVNLIKVNAALLGRMLLDAVSESRCPCGTIYERTEEPLPSRGKGEHRCIICDRLLEAWDGHVVPSFRLLRLPGAESEGRN